MIDRDMYNERKRIYRTVDLTSAPHLTLFTFNSSINMKFWSNRISTPAYVQTLFSPQIKPSSNIINEEKKRNERKEIASRPHFFFVFFNYLVA